jgi:predicted acylesterase/phospholipase RssA
MPTAMTDELASFNEQYLRASVPPPLKPRQVRRLAFEGGGGKGNAYLGALYALDDLKVLGQLETVAGASAGAITALCLSLGMRPAEIYTFIETTDFYTFFDDVADTQPTPGAPYQRAGTQERLARRGAELEFTIALAGPLIERQLYRAAKLGFSSARKSVEAALSTIFRLEDVVEGIQALYYGPGQPALIPASAPRVLTSEPPATLGQKVLGKVLNSVPAYMTSLTWDMGCFSGERARDTLARLIGDRIGPNVDLEGSTSRPGTSGASDALKRGRAVTFAQLDNYCRAKKLPMLRVAGSELCSTKSVIFSGATTAKFPVADAVRLSMGLPFIYKPYVIRSTGLGLPPCGVYVDGGVFSNLPLNAFSDEEASSTIGLRLEIDLPKPIYGFLGFVKAILKNSVLAGESTISSDRSRRCIRLDTEPLETIEFEVDPQTLKRTTARSHLTTFLFFGRADLYKPVEFNTGAPLNDQQTSAASRAAWDDLEQSIKDRQKAAGCVFAES